jgi:hypothetical protein
MAPQPSSDKPDLSQRPLPPDRVLERFARRIRDRPILDRLDTAAVEVFNAFDAAGVDALLLKGPVLARVLYGPTEHRGYVDVDLLVAPQHFDRVRHILPGLGYINLPEQLGLDEIARDPYAETWAQAGDGGAAGLMIDVHRTLTGSEAPPQAGWDAVWPRRTSIELDGHRLPAPDQETLALHIALHAARHGAGTPHPMEDLRTAIERWPPEVWRGADRLAFELQATAAFAAGLRQLPQGAALARDLGLPPTDDLEWAIAHRTERPRGTLHFQAFGGAATLRERASVLRRGLLPGRTWVAKQYPWADDHGVRLIGGYLAHLARTPVWAARAWRFGRRSRRR